MNDNSYRELINKWKLFAPMTCNKENFDEWIADWKFYEKGSCYAMSVEDKLDFIEGVQKEFIPIFDEDGNVNFKKENSTSNAKYHSDWCSMMYSRMMLARNLLSEDGVIFISIDDNEYENLKKISDEIFGNQNYLVTFHIQVRYTNKTLNEKNDWQPVMEYVLIYAKNAVKFKPNKPFTGYSLDAFRYKITELAEGKRIVVKGRDVDVFKKGEWTIEEVTPSMDGLKETWVSGSIYSGTGNGTMVQNVIEPRVEIDGYGSMYKIHGLGEDGLGYRYFQGPQKEGANRSKMFSAVPLVKRKGILDGTAVKYQSIPNIYDYSPDFGNIRHEGGISFNSGKKPVKMMKQIINYCTKKDALILDFFSGSASTAEGVMRLNAQDNGKRKFIMVQVPETTEETSDAYKAGFSTICELGKQRIRNVGEAISKENGILASSMDNGFRVFKLDESNMNDIYYSADEYSQSMLSMLESNVKADRTDLDLLFGCLLEWGLPLSLPYTSETIEGCTVHTYNDGDLIACFDENIPDSVVKTIAKRQPLRAVFRDSSFASSPSKINVSEVFKLLAPDTRVKVI